MKFKKTKSKPPKQKVFKGFSLTFRLSLGITLLITVLMAVVGFATFQRDRNTFIEETYSRGWSMTETVQTLATIPLELQNYRLLNELTTKLADDPFIRQAAILDGKGHFVAHSNPDELSSPEGGESIKEALGDKEKQSSYLTGPNGNITALTFSAPIKNREEKTTGYVYLTVDLSRVQAHLDKVIKDLLFNFALACIAALILTRLIIRRAVHRPVQSLVKATEKISTGDFSEQVNIRTRDELGRLGLAFNTMNEQLAILFQSIRSTVSDMVHTTDLLVQRSDRSALEKAAGDELHGEMMKEIHSSARRLNRISNKLNSLALQYKTQTTDPGKFW